MKYKAYCYIVFFLMIIPHILDAKKIVTPRLQNHLTQQIQGNVFNTIDPTQHQGIPSVIHQKKKPVKVKAKPKKKVVKPPVPKAGVKPLTIPKPKTIKKKKKRVKGQRVDHKYDAEDPYQLDFDVENLTGQTIYVACFAYLQTRIFAHWRWSKSPVYEIKPDKLMSIDVTTIKDKRTRKNVFAYLGVFNNRKQAVDMTFELIPDKNKIDLDLLYKVKGKKVVLEVERYGFKAPFLEYDFIDKKKTPAEASELDFHVTNNTGKTLLVCGFIYQKKAKTTWFPERYGKDDMSVWRFDKTDVVKIKDGQTALIDVDTIVTGRDRKYIRAYLALFEESEEQLALDATYELLDIKRKINLGRLRDLPNKSVIIEVEKYGVRDDIIDYVIKPVKHIEFSKVHSN